MYSKTNTKKMEIHLRKDKHNTLLCISSSICSTNYVNKHLSHLTYRKEPPYGIRSYSIVAWNSIFRYNLHMQRLGVFPPIIKRTSEPSWEVTLSYFHKFLSQYHIVHDAIPSLIIKIFQKFKTRCFVESFHLIIYTQ